VAGVFESRAKTTATTFSHPEGQPEHAPPPPRPFGLVAALIRSTPSALRGVSKPRPGSLRTLRFKPSPIPATRSIFVGVAWLKPPFFVFARSQFCARIRRVEIPVDFSLNPLPFWETIRASCPCSKLLPQTNRRAIQVSVTLAGVTPRQPSLVGLNDAGTQNKARQATLSLLQGFLGGGGAMRRRRRTGREGRRRSGKRRRVAPASPTGTGADRLAQHDRAVRPRDQGFPVWVCQAERRGARFRA
jgi:hypothetical protein